MLWLPVRERDLFQLGTLSMVLPELDPAHQGLLFADLSLEDPDLESIMGDRVSLEMKVMILSAVQRSQANNQYIVQLLDVKAKSLYSSAVGLVNDRVKTLKRFGKVQTALEIHLQSIVRKNGPFVREPSNSLAGVKLLKDSSTTGAMPSANQRAKKKRNRGSYRKTKGIPSLNPLIQVLQPKGSVAPKNINLDLGSIQSSPK